MLALLFERTHRVLLSRFGGSFTSEDMERVDRAVMLIIGREGPIRGILDFTDVETIEVSRARLAERARQPQIAAGQERVFVANKPHILAAAHVYATLQYEFGSMAPRIVSTLAEASALLGMQEPRFDPVDL